MLLAWAPVSPLVRGGAFGCCFGLCTSAILQFGSEAGKGHVSLYVSAKVLMCMFVCVYVCVCVWGVLFILRNGMSVSFVWTPQWALVSQRERLGPGPLNRCLGMVCSPPWPGPQGAMAGWAVVTSKFRKQPRLWVLFFHPRCPQWVCRTVEEA